MPTKHKLERLFAKKTKERLEIYFLIIQLFSLIMLILSQFRA
jgi:hypothetical protein